MLVMKEFWIQIRYILPLWFVQLLTNLLPDNRITIRLRGMLVRPFIGKCGKNLTLGSQVTLNNPQNLVVGDNVYIAKGTWLNALGGLYLEDEVVLAPYVVISTLQHVFKDGSVRFGGSTAAPVRIGKGSWLAAHVSVKCGVSIGKGNLIGANAFVVHDTPDFRIFGGVPAKDIKENHDGQASFYRRSDLNKKG